MQYYELTTLSTVIFGPAKAAPAIKEWVGAPDARGKLFGAWFSDIGHLNQVYLLRGFDSIDEMMTERERALRAPDAFGCGDLLTDLSMESYKSLDFLPPVEAGAFGPFYEIRTYPLAHGGLMPTTEKWAATIPARAEYSKLTVAMYSLDGIPRLTQIWPYSSLEARAKARAESVADGHWPPKGGPDWLGAAMTSTIALPLGFSPLT